jgi:hypothetical protein
MPICYPANADVCRGWIQRPASPSQPKERTNMVTSAVAPSRGDQAEARNETTQAEASAKKSAEPRLQDLPWVIQAARVAHEANRAYCTTIGDDSQVPWNEAPEWQQQSAIEGVVNIYNRLRASKAPDPRQQHDSWLEQKLRDGWTYAATKDPARKVHPCLLPYDSLPSEQKLKDQIFIAVAVSIMGERSEIRRLFRSALER